MSSVHAHYSMRLLALCAMLTVPLVAFGQTQYTSVHATFKCRSLNGSAFKQVPLQSASVHVTTVDGPCSVAVTDSNGSATLKYTSFDLAPTIEVVYSGTIKTMISGVVIASTLTVMNDGYTPRSEKFPQRAGVSSGGVLEVGLLESTSVDCDLWHHGAHVLDDFHSAIGLSPPAGGFRMLRRAGVVTGVPWTSYDVVEVPTDFMSSNEYAAYDNRRCTLLHEFGHTVRHVIDGTHDHWNGDVVKYDLAPDRRSP